MTKAAQCLAILFVAGLIACSGPHDKPTTPAVQADENAGALRPVPFVSCTCDHAALEAEVARLRADVVVLKAQALLADKPKAAAAVAKPIAAKPVNYSSVSCANGSCGNVQRRGLFGRRR